MCITVPDTCILAKSNQLIKYLSPSNSQTEALKAMPSFCLSCSINWLAIFGGSGLLDILQGLLHPRVLSQLMISGQVYCVKN